MSAVSIVTGSARGIGKAISERLAQAGWDLVLVDLDSKVVEVAETIASEKEVATRAITTDISTEEGVETVLRVCGEGNGSISGLVNNAGITRDSMLPKMGADSFRDVIRVNLGAACRLASAVAPSMEQGSIVNLSSKSANGNVGQFNYAVSKAGLIGLTKAMGLDFAPAVRVNAVAPAFIATEMTDAIPDDIRNTLISKIPFGRPGTVNEVAETVAWLLSSDSSYVTGQVVANCGGRSFAQ